MTRETRNDLEEEFAHYVANQTALVEDYDGKVIVLKGKQVIGVYDTEREAVINTRRHHEPGSFLVQRVSEGDESYTVTYHSSWMVFQ